MNVKLNEIGLCFVSFWCYCVLSTIGFYITNEMYGLLTKCEVKMAGYWPSSC